MTAKRFTVNCHSVESTELSAKITKSIYMELESQGHVAGDFLEEAGLSSQVALDSERWIPFDQVEYFLEVVMKNVPDFIPKNMALKAMDNRSWGLLDQVLRILQKPEEIYQDPMMFLSYFIKPLNGFKWIDRGEKHSSFETSLSSEEHPLITNYLKGALEVVSHYICGEAAQANWLGTQVSIDWSTHQDSFFKEREPANFKPEIYKEAVGIIQQQQTELQAFKELSNQKAFQTADTAAREKELTKDLKVLEDYFLRARQLVSLLKADSGKKKWFKDAVKRLNWEELQDLHASKLEHIKRKVEGTEASASTLSGFEEAEKQTGFQLDLQ